MTNEQHDHGDAELAEIWRNAHHRRANDLYLWIVQTLKKAERSTRAGAVRAGARVNLFAHQEKARWLPKNIEQ
jgi:hypothetical protein